MAERPLLTARITGAMREIERTDSERRRGKSDLQTTLAHLEERFNTRHHELERVRNRAWALTDANREIEACIERLSDLVEFAATEAAEASAALTLQLRTEMLPDAGRFEDVSQEELDAEEAALAAAEEVDIPRSVPLLRRWRH